METTFITPIEKWQGTSLSANGISNGGKIQEQGSLFQTILQNAIQDVKDTEGNLQYQQYLLATGQLDDPHTLQIAASEAQLSTNMLVQLRNKALDAYNELMRISL